MEDEKVVAILWTLVAVALVCVFAAAVTRARDAQQWSQVETIPTVTAPTIRGGK